MKAARSLLVSCMLVITMGHSVTAIHNHKRQTTPTSVALPGNPATTATPTTTSAQPTTTSNTSAATPINPVTSNTSTPPPQPTSNTLTSDTSTPTTPTTPINTQTSPPSDVPPSTSVSISTDPAGSTVELTVTNTLTSSSTSSSASSTPTKGADDGDNDSSLGTGSIIGISVAGGVAAIAIVAFLFWKFTRKRFNTFDDNEAIKWPELNAHGGNQDTHPLPVNNTGRAGFDTGSEASLSRVPSISNYSTPDVGAMDPYAVPPLPHMNPNQPYRDDPSSSYYDPYRGPVPGTLEHGPAVDDWTGENIPMTQMTGRASPGPYTAYNSNDYGAQNPAGSGRTASPGPGAAYGGRASPAPQAAYGGRASPGPQAAYNSGRMSPGAQASLDFYGGRQ